MFSKYFESEKFANNFNPANFFIHNKYPCYIQSHAINRLIERVPPQNISTNQKKETVMSIMKNFVDYINSNSLSRTPVQNYHLIVARYGNYKNSRGKTMSWKSNKNNYIIACSWNKTGTWQLNDMPASISGLWGLCAWTILSAFHKSDNYPKIEKKTTDGIHFEMEYSLSDLEYIVENGPRSIITPIVMLYDLDSSKFIKLGPQTK